MTQRKSPRLTEGRLTRFLIGGIVGVLIVVGILLLYGYGSTGIELINSYYATVLDRRELNGIYGPHYWKDGEIFWIANRHLKKSSDLGVSSVDVNGVPPSFDGPALFVSESILADKSNVYLRHGDRFNRVLQGFICWYICGSQLGSGDFVVGEYGSRIYHLDAVTGQTSLLFEKPPETRHFHFTAVDPFTGDIYTSLGDAHKALVTGIMRSQDGGKTWRWIYRNRGAPRAAHVQPTAVYFDQDKIYFGKDNPRPPGIFIMDRTTGKFDQVFVMAKFFKSWFIAITQVKGSFWAISRSFTDLPKRSFGLLWWSGDGNDWVPIQVFNDAPVWLETDDKRNLLSIGFLREDSNVIAFDIPEAAQMAKWISDGPTISWLDRTFGRELRGAFQRLLSDAKQN